MGKKGAMPSYKTIDDYIAAQKDESHRILHELRDIVKKGAPDCTENENYKVPTFTLVDGGKRDHQIMFAAYAKFVSFYPFPTTMEKFSNELSDYQQGKGCVQFPFDAELPKDLLIEMVKYRREELKSAN